MRHARLSLVVLLLAGLHRSGAAMAAEPAKATEGYASPELLVETGWLAGHLQDARLRIADLRSADAYAKGHIPGAVRFEEGPLRNPKDTVDYLPAPADAVRMLSAAGIGDGDRVIAYDDEGGRSAARLWYVLQAYGHERASLLNGGWKKWTAEKRPESTEPAQAPAAKFTPRRMPALGCPSPEVLEKKPGRVVLDARSAAEFEGREASKGSEKAGRVPGAVHVEWKENVTGPSMVFKPAAELRELYAKKGVTPDREVVTYCASGGRAAHSLFALKLLGFPRVKVYYGSFADYSHRPEAPVEK